MSLDLPQFYRVCNPCTTLDLSEANGQKYYIDFSSVRNGNIIDDLQANITVFSPEAPTCQLLTGHIGSGKTTELLRLKSILEEAGFQVVYLELSQILDLSDTDIGEILLAIAIYLIQACPGLKLNDSIGNWKIIVQELRKIFDQTEESRLEIDDTEAEKGERCVLSGTLRDFAICAKRSAQVRLKLRQYLEPRISLILEALNTEIIAPVTAELKRLGKNGLVTIVDNFDRLEAVRKPWGRSQPEYIFVDRGEQLCKLNCHVIYTIPLSLIFSKDFATLTQRFGCDPKILPAIPVRDRQGKSFQAGIAQLQQMILARAFPNVAPLGRVGLIPQLFDDPQTFDRLCYISGGHARNLLRLLHRCIEKERRLPLSRKLLEVVIQERSRQLVLSLSGEERELLRHVTQIKRISGTQNYQFLLRNLFVFEYEDSHGTWFDINPILSEVQEFAR